MLSAHSITHKYNEFIALDSVSIDIKPGEIVGLLGKNGAGKSSLMRVLTGFMQPTEGVVYFDGLDLRDKAKIIQAQIGYLPENNILYAIIEKTGERCLLGYNKDINSIEVDEVLSLI